MELKKGIRVEVCSSEEGYGGAWFEGVILSATPDGRRCKIRYDKFVTDDGKPLEGEVCLQTEVRPIPPHIQLPLHCSVGDAVEAYDTDCWWRGMIAKLVTGAEEELWVVYFPDTRTVKEYPHSDLRPAQQWLRGKWIRTPQESSTIVEEVLRCFGFENSEETPLISGGEIDGEKKRRAVMSKEAFLGGGASCKRKKLKTLRQEDSSYGLEIRPSSFSFKFSKKSPGRRAFSKKSPGRRAAEAAKRNGNVTNVFQFDGKILFQSDV